jgi:hypothetical protein
MRRLIVLFPVFALLLPGSAAAATRTVEHVSSGTVDAELSYLKKPDKFVGTAYTDLRVKITRAGVVVRDEKVPGVCAVGCSPALALAKKKSIQLRDLDGDEEPEVLVDLFTGGANCCLYSLFYGYQASSGKYSREEADFGTYGYRLLDRKHDGKLQLKGGDVAFRGAFGCNACGPQPIEIQGWDGQRLRVITSKFPGLVRADARSIKRGYLRHRKQGPEVVKGFLAPYAADRCSLGSCRAGLKVVRGAIRRGEVNARFLPALRRLLKRQGYLG